MTKKQKKMLFRIITALCFLIVLHLLPAKGWIRWMLYLIPYLIIGYDILKKAALGVIHGEIFDENFLMAVATLGAMILGDYREATAVMVFYQIGELFQSVAVGKSRKNISALMDIRPDYANVESENGELKQMDPDMVETGTVIVVRAGERVPIDGVIIQGSSTLNTSALTGESHPKEVSCGDDIFSGCVNLSGLLKVRTTKEFGESTASKILELVEDSGMKKAKVEKFISRFAHYYTPVVCYSALALAVIPPVIRIILGQPAYFTDWLVRALTFLVISCPCALVISIPLSFFGGIGGASSCGILVKGANYLEALARTKYIVFDKTGTLTKGIFQVTQIVPQDLVSGDELLKIAAYAECYSHHPISKSVREAYGDSIEYDQVSDVEEFGGYGVKAFVMGRHTAVGNARLMESLGINITEQKHAGTSVYVAVDGQYAGHILIADVVKEQSCTAIQQLKKCGIKKTIMLTGDTKAVADTVAACVGIDEVKSELLPADKVKQVEQLLAEKRNRELVAYVGDGINDAPVLARADIGIAMGAMGSDAAIEAADVVLMDDNPSKIALAIQLSRRCLGIVYQNIVFALGIKAVCLILGAMGKADMWLAIFADVGVMILAVLNAVRCLKVKHIR